MTTLFKRSGFVLVALMATAFLFTANFAEAQTFTWDRSSAGHPTDDNDLWINALNWHLDADYPHDYNAGGDNAVFDIAGG